AAEPSRKVAYPRSLPQPVREELQRLVAALVAEAVVDQLEIVQIDEQQRTLAAAAAGLRQALAQHLAEGAAVEQPGHRIVAREPLQRLVVLELRQRYPELTGEIPDHG